jgi:hypothetical protein
MNKETVEEIKAVLNAESFDAKLAANLYFQYGKNQTMAKTFIRNPSRYSKKIHYELSKILGVTLSQYKGFDVAQVSQEKVPLPVINRIKEELKTLYPLRVDLQKQLSELPQDNSEETKQAAIEIGAKADELAVRYQLLYDSKEMFFKDGTIPDEDFLFPDEDNLEDNPNSTLRDVEDPYGLKSKNPADVVNRRNNLISSLTKDRNMIKYQAKTTMPQENPMPEGEARKKIEERISLKEAEINAINIFLDANKS